jgi:hypothetical protein
LDFLLVESVAAGRAFSPVIWMSAIPAQRSVLPDLGKFSIPVAGSEGDAVKQPDKAAR